MRAESGVATWKSSSVAVLNRNIPADIVVNHRVPLPSYCMSVMSKLPYFELDVARLTFLTLSPFRV